MTTLRFDPKAPITWEGVLAAGHGFLRWWGGTLWELLPQAWHHRVRLVSGRWTLSMEPGAWRLCGPAGTEEELLLDPAAPDEELEERIARFAAASHNNRIDVLIPPQSGLTRTVRLPAAAQAQLRSVVGLQLGRLSPLRPEDVRFDCRRTGAEADEIIVDVGIVPKKMLATFEERLTRLGFAIDKFRFQGLPFGFAPIETRRTSQEKLRYALCAIAAVSLAAAIVLAPLLRAAELESLSSEVRGMAAPAHRAASLGDKLHLAAVPVHAVDIDLERPSALNILQRLTKLLPADVELTDLRIDAAAVRVAGYGGDSKDLVTLLRRSGEFEHVTLSGPIGKASDGRERFEIEMSAR